MSKKYVLWSNAFFVIPLGVSIYFGLYVYSAIAGALLLVSIFFHLRDGNRILFYLDSFFAGLLMFANFLLLFSGGWAMPASIIAVVLAVLAMLSYGGKLVKDPGLSHFMWHIFSAGVSLFCILSFFS